MDDYTLVNRFTVRYRTEKRTNVRSREVMSLVIESYVLKKKRECEREEEEGSTCEGFHHYCAL
jgi:hypothetical protein